MRVLWHCLRKTKRFYLSQPTVEKPARYWLFHKWLGFCSTAVKTLVMNGYKKTGLAAMSLIISLCAYGHIDTVRIAAHDSVPLYMTVYTPPCYSPDSIYPVLYLLHGIHGNQYSWEEKGHISTLSDSLITNDSIRPVIIVMPLCIVHDSTYATRIPDYVHCMHDYLHHIKKGEFEAYFPEIETYITQHYPIQTNGNAIAGLSSGARQAAIISQTYDFAVVGLFSPVLSKHQLPYENTDCVYWIRSGRSDLFYPRAQKANRYLNRNGVEHYFERTSGHHNWKVWRIYIGDFLIFAFGK